MAINSLNLLCRGITRSVKEERLQTVLPQSDKWIFEQTVRMLPVGDRAEQNYQQVC